MTQDKAKLQRRETDKRWSSYPGVSEDGNHPMLIGEIRSFGTKKYTKKEACDTAPR